MSVAASGGGRALSIIALEQALPLSYGVNMCWEAVRDLEAECLVEGIHWAGLPYSESATSPIW